MKKRDKILSIFLVLVMLITFMPMDMAADIFKTGNEIIRMNGNTKESNKGENKDSQPQEESNKPQEENNNSQEEDRKEEDNKPQENNQQEDNKNEETDKENPQEENQQNNGNEQNNKLNWPSKPSWINYKPATLSLQSGQNKSDIYAVPVEGTTNQDVKKAQEESQKEGKPEEKGKPIDEKKFNGLKLEVHIDGKKFEPDKNETIVVKNNQQFHFKISWDSINGTSEDNNKISKGDYFEKELFKVKNLQFGTNMSRRLIINGIYVGEMTFTYNKDTGSMMYRVTFNEYINIFTYGTIAAYFEGSSTFKFTENGEDNFEIWGSNGSIKYEKDEVIPNPPPVYPGTGWKPENYPTFRYETVSFKKSWSYRNAQWADQNPMLEWRITFVEKLQKLQLDYLKENPIEDTTSENNDVVEKVEDTIETIKEKVEDTIEIIKNKIPKRGMSQRVSTNGNCIIEDELSKGQRFAFTMYNHAHSNSGKKLNNSPFYIELPIMVVGTDEVLNQYANGARKYKILTQGIGYVEPYISGSKFTQILTDKDVKEEEEKGNHKRIAVKNEVFDITTENEERINKIKKEYVESHPGTYTILNQNNTTSWDEGEKLIINVGKLDDPTNEFLSFKNSSKPNDYKVFINDKINFCTNKIRDIENGMSSPIHFFKSRYESLNTVFDKALINTQNNEDIKNKVNEFKKEYEDKIINSKLSDDAMITNENIPNIGHLIYLGDNLIIDEAGTLLKDNNKYKDFKVSLENLVKNQEIYLRDKSNSLKGWKLAKTRYERTLEFYDKKGISGFIVKVPSDIINTSLTQFSNRANIYNGDEKYSDGIDVEAKYSGGITGSYDIGSTVVEKKFDGVLENTKEVRDKLKEVTFNLYCKKDQGEKLATFYPKEASENGNTYKYDIPGNVASGENKYAIKDLKLNSDENAGDNLGKFGISNISQKHDHILKEINGPKGYYSNEVVIPKNSQNTNKVNRVEINNISRSVKITKEDSFSGYGIAGAKFKLYEGDSENGKEITGFTKKTINGHTAYWHDGTGKENLETYFFEGNGNKAGLCIHGLDAGTYTLVEESPGVGYELDENNKPKFTFVVEKSKPQNGLDEQNHIVNDINGTQMTVKNDAKTANLSLTKIDGNTNETNKKNNLIEKLKNLIVKDENNTSPKGGEVLDNVGFILLGFNGNDKDWINSRKDVSKFVIIDPDDVRFNNKGNYFKTSNTINKVTVNIPESTLNGKEVKAIFTDYKGQINIENIPRGYYALSEVKPHDGYHVSKGTFFFRIYGNEENKEVTLYRSMNPTDDKDKILKEPFINPIEKNTIKNFKRLLKIKLIKYEEGKNPTINGTDYGNGNYPYGSTVNSENAALLQGAKYKLFYKPFEGEKKNPDPEQLKPGKADEIIPNKEGFDKCVAYGTTNEQGELDISGMKDEKNNNINGLHEGNYYLVETVAPRGFMLDQNPIPFKLDEKLFDQNTNPNDENYNNIGLLKLASNKRGKSSIKVIKEDIENGEKISGAEFIVKEQKTNKLLEVKEITGKEGEYEVVKTDTITPSPDTSNKEENIVQRIKEKFVSIFKGTEDNSVKNEIDGYKEIGDNFKLKTNKDGTFRLRGLVGHEDYTIVEIKAPRGYKLPEKNETEFNAPRTEDDEGAIEDKEEKLVYLEKVIRNERLLGKISLRKIDTDTKKGLVGAEFTIYRKKDEYATEPINKNDNNDKDDNNDIEYIDKNNYEKVKSIEIKDENSPTEVGDLEWGDYYIEETKAPDGYILDSSLHVFTIERNSFDYDGNPIVLQFHNLENSAIGKRKVKIIKKDEEDNLLKGVEFQLFRKFEVESNEEGKKEEVWLTYGEGRYTTNDEGVIELTLPYGQYKMIEVKSDDHIVDPKEIFFEVKKSHTDSEEHKLEMEFINFKNNDDGIPIYMRKSLNYNGGNTNFVIENAEFNIFDNPEGKNPLYFREIRKGIYKYSKGPKDKKIDGQKITTNLVTDKNGEIRLLLPKEYIPKEGENKKLYYKEVKAPEGVIIDESIKEIKIDKDSNHKWTDIEIQNEFKDKDNGVKIEIQKVDDNNRPLKGAEFTLYKYPGDSEEQKIVSKYTDKDGIVVFEDKDFKEIGESGFVGGKIYTIKETKAPTDGYIRDQVILDIEIDKNAFEQNNGSVTSPIMTVRAVNSRYKGILTLKKVDKKDNKALAGAEFKLYKKVEIQPRENIGKVKEDNPDTNPNSWHPYGYGIDKGTYVTNKNGVLEIKDLPLGDYYYIETKAPVGYKILPGSSGTFKVEKQNESHLHEINITVENEEIQGKKGSVELEKVNSKGEHLEGVEFKLYKREFYNGIEYPIEYGNNPYITDESGKITIDNIPIGNYYLEETKTLDGYVLPNKEDRKFYFDVTENTKDKIKFKVENKTPEEVIPPGPVDPNKPDKPDKPVDPNKPDKPDKPVDPNKPDKPDKPVDPNKPDKPDKPVNPDKPDKPDKPVDPNKPDKPDKPVDPNKPDKPNRPGNTDNSSNSGNPSKPSIINKIPKTGDSAQLLATGAVFVGAGAGLFAIRRNNKKTITRSGRRSRKNRRKRK